MKSLIIIIIIVIIVIIAITSISKETFAIDLDKVQYGTITKKEQKLSNRKIVNFKLPLPMSTISPPLLNSAKETKAELDYIIKLKRPEKIPDFDIYKTYLKYAGENGLIYDEEHLKSISDDIDTFGLKLKYIYNRPRPYQLAFLYQKPFHSTEKLFSPSYPSTSTLKANVLTNVLSYNNPKHKTKLNAIAKKVELSRLLNGYNYPSDNEIAIKISDILKDRIKYLEIKK